LSVFNVSLEVAGIVNNPDNNVKEGAIATHEKERAI